MEIVARAVALRLDCLQQLLLGLAVRGRASARSGARFLLADERALDAAARDSPEGRKSMSPCPSSDSAPFWSRITRESVWEATAKAIRAGTFALIIPVITSALGRWVASSRWMPIARDFWASRITASSTSGATIIRSASSSMTQRMYCNGFSPCRIR